MADGRGDGAAPEQWFRVMADGTPVIIWVSDSAGRLVYINRAYTEFFGVTLEQVDALDWRTLVHAEDWDDYVGRFGEALAGRRPFRSIARVRRRDGQWRWIESFAAPWHRSDGSFGGMVGSSPDVTERVEAERSLREADAQKDRFIATLSHELRNPLAPIRNGLYLLRSRVGDDPALAGPLELMERQLGHMVRLIDELMDVSRISRGVLSLHSERVDLAAVLEGVLGDVRPQMEREGRTLQAALPPGPVHVDGDPLRLSQVFFNLLDNARKYGKPDGVVFLELAVQDGTVMVTVRDDGIGIEPESLPRLFDMFAQGRPMPGKAPQGLGIGLWLVRRLVELHGGRVEARSEGPGRGSELVVRLPVAAGPASP